MTIFVELVFWAIDLRAAARATSTLHNKNAPGWSLGGFITPNSSKAPINKLSNINQPPNQPVSQPASMIFKKMKNMFDLVYMETSHWFITSIRVDSQTITITSFTQNTCNMNRNKKNQTINHQEVFIQYGLRSQTKNTQFFQTPTKNQKANWGAPTGPKNCRW